MKLEVGMYARTKEGFIAKIKEIKTNERLHLYLKTIYTDNYQIDMVLEDEISKASHNIIDLIEIGDVITYKTDMGSIRVQDVHNSVVMSMIKDKEIEVLSIVTSQQFESMQYKID